MPTGYNKLTKNRLEMTLFLNEKWFGGLLDTGADVSVIAARHWPKSWPCQPSAADLQGVRGCSWPPPECSADLLEG
jgi:hypothetical protein